MESELQVQSKSVEFESSVRRAIADLLPLGQPALHRVADTMNMNSRTLQRRLAEFGLTYRQLVDEVRLETARRLFENSELGLSIIAYSLGYSDPAHFSRAFVRWTGTTPWKFRCRGSLQRRDRS